MKSRAAGIALFDLDYTLLGGDATYEWIHFLVRKGAIDAATHRASRQVLRGLRQGHARHRRLPAFRFRAY
jgi:phosphoserine phosphatase